MLINHQTWISCKAALINAVHTSQQGFHSHMKKFATHDEIARDGCHKSVESHGQWVIPCQELHEPLQQADRNEADVVWRKDLAALSRQKEGHSWTDGERERAVQENEGLWKVHSSLKIFRGRKAFFVIAHLRGPSSEECGHFLLVFRQKLFPDSKKESVHLGKFNAAKNIPDNECQHALSPVI